MSPVQYLFARSSQSSGGESLVNTSLTYKVICVPKDMRQVWWEFSRGRGKVPAGLRKGGSEKAMRFMSYVAKHEQELIRWRCSKGPSTGKEHCLFKDDKVCFGWIPMCTAKALNATPSCSACLCWLPSFQSGKGSGTNRECWFKYMNPLVEHLKAKLFWGLQSHCYKWKGDRTLMLLRTL